MISFSRSLSPSLKLSFHLGVKNPFHEITWKPDFPWIFHLRGMSPERCSPDEHLKRVFGPEGVPSAPKQLRTFSPSTFLEGSPGFCAWEWWHSPVRDGLMDQAAIATLKRGIERHGGHRPKTDVYDMQKRCQLVLRNQPFNRQINPYRSRRSVRIAGQLAPLKFGFTWLSRSLWQLMRAVFKDAVYRQSIQMVKSPLQCAGHRFGYEHRISFNHARAK